MKELTKEEQDNIFWHKSCLCLFVGGPLNGEEIQIKRTKDKYVKDKHLYKRTGGEAFTYIGILK